MKVKIYKCSNPNHWYSDKIGQEFEVETHSSIHSYKVKDSIKLISLEDTMSCGGFRVKSYKKDYTPKNAYEELRSFLQAKGATPALKQALYKLYKDAEYSDWWDNGGESDLLAP